MKYTEALAQKGLPLEELSKSIQKKVAELTFLSEQIQALQKEDLDEKTAVDVKNFSLRLAELDEEISENIIRFDKEKHLKKLKQLEEFKIQKQLKKGISADAAEFVKSMPKLPIKEQVEVVAPIQEASTIKKVAAPIEETQVPQYEDNDQYVEAEEEFEVKSSQKQKNGSLNLLLIGAGVFLLTWGAVNMFRESRK